MYMSILSTLALALLLAIPCYAGSHTYWVDASCYGKTGFDMDKTVTGALSMAKRASERLGSSTDTDFAYVFKKIFSIDKGDKTQFNSPTYNDEKVMAYDVVEDIMNSIGTEWTLVKGDDQRAGSEARIYCDNGKHFDKVRAKGGWIDSINKVRGDDKCAEGLAFTSLQRLAIRPTDPQQNKQRFTHTDAYGLDHGEDPKDDYGWDNVVQKNTQDSIENADNYAYLGLWALLADRKPGGEPRGGHTLARPWIDATKGDGLISANDATKGKIYAYQDITDMVTSTKKMIRRFFG